MQVWLSASRHSPNSCMLSTRTTTPADLPKGCTCRISSPRRLEAERTLDYGNRKICSQAAALHAPGSRAQTGAENAPHAANKGCSQEREKVMTEDFTTALGRRYLESIGQPAYGSPSDPVEEAGKALEQAQARLQLAESRKSTIPYDHRQPQRLREWKAAVSDVEAAKVAVKTAEKAWNVARNDAASARIQAGFRAKEKERTEQQEREQKQHADLEEAAFRERAWSAYVAEGGTRDQFDKAFEGMWRAELRRRTEARMGAQERELRASGRYSF